MIYGPPLTLIRKRPLAVPGLVIHAVILREVEITGTDVLMVPDSAEALLSECLESSLDCPAPAQVNIFRLSPPR